MIDSKNHKEIIGIIEEAAQAILAIKSTGCDTTYKGDGSECTNADIVANEIICNFLNKVYPHVPIISEESLLKINLEYIKKAEYFWLLDPLDGTKGFINNKDYYSINLALIFRGKPVYGIICFPERKITYYNIQNKLYKKISNSIKEIKNNNISTKCIKVVISKRTSKEEIIKLFNLKSDKVEISSLPGAVKFCYLIEGIYDIFPRFTITHEWDVAAGHALINACGGKMITRNNQDLTYLKPGFINHEIIAVRSQKYLKFIS